MVLDTNILVSATLGAGGASRALLRLCLEGRLQPLMGETLFSEIEDVFGRARLFEECALARDERDELLNAYFNVCEWVHIYFLWRPNLPDEGDNHLIELAVAAGADTLITHNVRDVQRGELKFSFRIETPAEFLKRWREKYGYNDDQNARR